MENDRNIKKIAEYLRQIAKESSIFQRPLGIELLDIRNILSKVCIDESHPSLKHFFDVANKALITVDNRNNAWLNPVSLGQIISILDMVISEENRPTDFACIHPNIRKTSMKLYLDGHYANAAEDAFIEVNDRAKDIYKVLRPEEKKIPDGVDLMHRLFRDNAILELADISTETGSNIQQGYHFMFAGAISALRNPKAHSNKESITAQESMRRLMFASMLMYKLDEAEKME